MGYFCLVLVLVLVVSGIICAFVFHKRRLKQLNDIKFFYSNVSKLLRTPISNLVSQLKSLSGDENKDENELPEKKYYAGEIVYLTEEQVVEEQPVETEVSEDKLMELLTTLNTSIEGSK